MSNVSIIFLCGCTHKKNNIETLDNAFKLSVGELWWTEHKLCVYIYIYIHTHTHTVCNGKLQIFCLIADCIIYNIYVYIKCVYKYICAFLFIKYKNKKINVYNLYPHSSVLIGIIYLLCHTYRTNTSQKQHNAHTHAAHRSTVNSFSSLLKYSVEHQNHYNSQDTKQNSLTQHRHNKGLMLFGYQSIDADGTRAVTESSVLCHWLQIWTFEFTAFPSSLHSTGAGVACGRVSTMNTLRLMTGRRFRWASWSSCRRNEPCHQAPPQSCRRQTMSKSILEFHSL